MGVPGFDSIMQEVSHARPSQWSKKLIKNKGQHS